MATFTFVVENNVTASAYVPKWFSVYVAIECLFAIIAYLIMRSISSSHCMRQNKYHSMVLIDDLPTVPTSTSHHDDFDVDNHSDEDDGSSL